MLGLNAQEALYVGDQWLAEQYLELGRSTRDIARETGRCKSTVDYWLRRAGIPLRPPHPSLELDHNALYEMYVLKRMSVKRIGAHLSCSPATVLKYLHEEGIEVRSPRSAVAAGETFGSLTALRRIGRNEHRSAIWRCRCTCGELFTLLASNLVQIRGVYLGASGSQLTAAAHRHIHAVMESELAERRVNVERAVSTVR